MAHQAVPACRRRESTHDRFVDDSECVSASSLDSEQILTAFFFFAVYSACTAAKGDQEAGVPAILSRFFRLAIRALSIGNSLPPTRQGSPRNGVRCKSGSGDAAGGGSYENPFDQLGPQLVRAKLKLLNLSRL